MKLETPRLILREFTPQDLDEFASLMANPEVMRFSLHGPIKRQVAQDYLEKRILNHYSTYGYGLYALINKSDNHFIGYTGLLSQIIDGESKVELGYRLFPQYWGKGLATEAGLAVCQYAFNELHIPELISIIEAENTKSIAVAKRLGMHYLKEALFHEIPVHIYHIRSVKCVIG